MRKKTGLSQEKLAERVGIYKRQWQYVESAIAMRGDFFPLASGGAMATMPTKFDPAMQADPLTILGAPLERNAGGFYSGGTVRLAHHPVKPGPQGGEQITNHRWVFRKPESKLLPFPSVVKN